MRFSLGPLSFECGGRPRGILRVNVQMQSGVEGVDQPLYFRMVDLLPAAVASHGEEMKAPPATAPTEGRMSITPTKTQ